MRHVLAENVKKLLEHHYHESRNRPKLLAKEAGVSLSTVQRILASEVGASLDNIEAIAQVFELSAYQLLLPALSPPNPQVVHGATQGEERLYRRYTRGRSHPAKADS